MSEPKTYQRMIIALPGDARDRFKEACRLAGTTMNDAITAWVLQYLKEQEEAQDKCVH